MTALDLAASDVALVGALDSSPAGNDGPVDHPEPPPTASGPAGSGTRQRLDHIDAMRPVKQVGVISTHTILAFAPVGASLAANAALLLLHVTRESFLFVSACMLTYSFRDGRAVGRDYWTRRFAMVGIPYLCWTVIYFCYTLPDGSGSLGTRLAHLWYLTWTGYYQLYYLVVLLQFYVLFPLLLWGLRATSHHVRLLVVVGLAQLGLVSYLYWGHPPTALNGFWSAREVTSYLFYLLAGMVVALHLEAIHDWLVQHRVAVVLWTVGAAGFAELWYFGAWHHVLPWLVNGSAPFQPSVVPWNIGAIASLYLLGLALVDRRRSAPLRAAVRSGSDNAYGVYLAQMVFILALGWLGWSAMDHVMPWPLVCALTVVLVFGACVGLTELLARTPLAKPLTGRSRVRRLPAPADPTDTGPLAVAGD